MKAASPPAFWASAMMCRPRVVLPLDSGPKISTMRPRGNPAHAEGQVEGEGAGGDRGYLLGLLVAHAHDRAFPELPLYLRYGGIYSLAPIQCILQKATVLAG
jgi:hypothetical protein